MARRVEPRATVVCERCGDPWEAAASYARAIRRGEYQPVCETCRHPNRRVTVVVTAAHRRYWTRRWTVEEIVAVGLLIWPELRPEDEGLRELMEQAA